MSNARLDDTTLIGEAEYSINFTGHDKKICLSLNYNESNNFLLVNRVKIYQFKGKDSDLNPYLLCLGNTSKYFTIYNMKETALNGYVYDFSFYYSIGVVDTLDIHKYLMKKINIK